MPLFGHGEMVEKPRPTPNTSKISESAAAAAAPAKIALQDTPDEVLSDAASEKICSVVCMVASFCELKEWHRFMCKYVRQHT
jgi:hypothetical protein